MLANRMRSAQDYFEINHSCIFDSATSDFLARTTTAGNRRTYTISFWAEVDQFNTNEDNIISQGSGATTLSSIRVISSDEPVIAILSITGGITGFDTRTALIKSGWTHYLFRVDTTDAVSTNRVRIYSNADLSGTVTSPALNLDTQFNVTAETLRVGSNFDASANFLNGQIAEFHFVDGLSLGPDSFTRTVDGILRPIQYSGDHGTNGFHLTFGNASNLGEDVSGSANDLTVNGSPTQSTDTPTR